MAHPNMEDANVALLISPDGEFACKNIQTIVSKRVGLDGFGRKNDQNEKRALHSGCHGLPELK